mmetsp:Transcript_34710/g.81032  ORF Transcript_34710/g.81032 Transcript_34710/m.81032 type:complete len:193 (-) Transcript_34710:698-1276(-)
MVAKAEEPSECKRLTQSHRMLATLLWDPTGGPILAPEHGSAPAGALCDWKDLGAALEHEAPAVELMLGIGETPMPLLGTGDKLPMLAAGIVLVGGNCVADKDREEPAALTAGADLNDPTALLGCPENDAAGADLNDAAGADLKDPTALLLGIPVTDPAGMEARSDPPPAAATGGDVGGMVAPAPVAELPPAP